MDKIIEVNNVSKAFGKGENLNQVLNGASMSVEKGEFVSLMGASGSGKSTLLYLIGGLDRNFEGNISVCGQDIGSMKDKALSDLRLKNMGFVFQFYNLVMNLSVQDNILLPQTMNGKKRSELKGALDEILEITGLTEKRKAMPATLSGGQQQRVAIARAIATGPSLILADEPTGNLDSQTSKEIMDIFKELHRQGNTIVLITHDPDVAKQAERSINILDGKITEVRRYADA